MTNNDYNTLLQISLIDYIYYFMKNLISIKQTNI